MLFAVIVFLLSLLGVVALFGLKQWEEKRGRILVPHLREKADARALWLKELGHAARADFAKVPPELSRLSHIAIHEAALAFAAFARAAERNAHRVADLVSHKRHFERRETRSEFLKKVSEHKGEEE